jgi:hypothetical protein
MKQLLVDYLPFEIPRQQITESMKENKGKLIVKGVLQRAESKKYDEDFIKQSRALGELDHPESSVVNLANASHNIIDMHWKNDDLVGTVEVLGTPAGNILKELFKSGIKLGISSRGLGSVETVREGDAQQVQSDFELIAFDFVSNPSTQGAFMYPMNEGVDKGLRPDIECGVWCKAESIINDIIRGI